MIVLLRRCEVFFSPLSGPLSDMTVVLRSSATDHSDTQHPVSSSCCFQGGGGEDKLNLQIRLAGFYQLFELSEQGPLVLQLFLQHLSNSLLWLRRAVSVRAARFG